MDLRALKVGVKIECSGQPAQANNVRRWDGHLKVRHFSVREAWVFDLGWMGYVLTKYAGC